MINIMKKEITLYKIPLEALIDALTSVYEKGADFIDIIAIPNEIQTMIGIAVKDEYIFSDEEEEEEENNIDFENYVIKKNIKLTDDDVSKLEEYD